MEITHALLYALSWLVLFNPTKGLQCYKCAGMQATLNGVENGDTADIIATINGILNSFLGMSFNDDCMSTDVTDLQSFEGADTCSSSEHCGYLNMTLTNENYDNKGELVLAGTIRQCQVWF